MLGLDLDLEADLGIDSIKRVEILGTVRDELTIPILGSESELMDQLSRARTLGAIVERLAQRSTDGLPAIRQNGSVSVLEQPESAVVDHERWPREEAGRRVRRMVLRPIEVPLRLDGRDALAPGGVVLITDDGQGVARALAETLNRRGFRPFTVRHVDGPFRTLEPAGVELDLNDPARVDRLCEHARALGRVAGLVHALPLRCRTEVGLNPALWAERLGPEVRGLFLLARALADDLERSAGQGGAAVIAATALGGGFASLPGAAPDFFPGQAAVAGLLKTLAHEWPSVRARVVDLDPRETAETLAGRLVTELLARDPRTEVGYSGGRRLALDAVESPLGRSGNGGVSLRAGEPLLVTGGARGITAAVAADLAERWRPTLLVVGSSPLPGEERPELAGLVEPSEVKARLLQRLQAERGDGTPAGLERTYQRFRRDREIRSNLRRLRETGATVEYSQADVRDLAALGVAVEGWRRRFGPLAGFIHGAGVIHDKLLRDKTPESFDRVVGTKLEGALNLARLVDPDALKFAAFFSSVAGRFGNRGQADYAAANDALNKLAVWLDRRWPGRVVSMIWGPWSGVGMVSDLEHHLVRRGLGMIDPSEGRSRLADELRFGRKGEVEVIVAGDLGNLATTTQPGSAS
jgi:NAD(P)-dependent dehydrogenase (short-subunit alcohol dehydrogenase family)